jgi:hypothetical protein
MPATSAGMTGKLTGFGASATDDGIAIYEKANG